MNKRELVSNIIGFVLIIAFIILFSFTTNQSDAFLIFFIGLILGTAFSPYVYRLYPIIRDKILDRLGLYEDVSNNMQKESIQNNSDSPSKNLRYMKTLNVLTVDHPRWREFCDLLEGDKKWSCDARTLTRSTMILDKYFPEIDIPSTLEYFRKRGGYCDCEVLMNVDVESE